MGTDKAFLELAGRSLLSNALELANAAAEKVVIIGAASKFSRLGAVVEDIFPDRGPLGGIHAALTASQSELNLILGVDMPFLQASFLQFLISVASEIDALVTVPRVSGRYEPLCAVYRKEFARLADNALEAGRNKIDALFGDVLLRAVNEEELAQHAFSPAMFRNVNTPEDWKCAQEDFTREHSSRGHLS